MKVLLLSIASLAALSSQATAATYDCRAAWWNNANPIKFSEPVKLDPATGQVATIELVKGEVYAMCGTISSESQADATLFCTFKKASGEEQATQIGPITATPNGAPWIAMTVPMYWANFTVNCVKEGESFDPRLISLGY